MRNLITILLVVCSFNVFSQEGRNIERLAFGEGDEKVEAIAALVASGDEKALAVLLALVKKALARETNADVKSMLEQIDAALELKADDRDARLAAVKKLGSSNSPGTKTLLLGFLNNEKDEELRGEARKSLQAIEGRL